MADDAPRHISPTASSWVSVAGMMLALGSIAVALPNRSEIDRLWKSVDEHHALIGHAGVVSQTAAHTAELESVKTSQRDMSRRITELKTLVETMRARQIANQERGSRMDEALRHVDLSVPPLSDRLATTEANLKAAMTAIDMLQRLNRQPTLREPER